MDRENFLRVLQATLLAYDDVGVKEMFSNYGISEQFAEVGFNLSNYLKLINIKESLE